MRTENRREWLLLMFEIPASRSNLRVKVWRKLQKTGALNLKSSVYVLPQSPEAEEDFDWLRQAILDGGGQATLMSGRASADLDDKDIIRRFQEIRVKDWPALRKEILPLKRILAKARALSADRLRGLGESLRGIQERYSEIGKMDYFPARERADIGRELEALRQRLHAAMEPEPRKPTDRRGKIEPAAYRGRTWATREGMHVDRLASAWLIRRFIDPKSKFIYVGDKLAKHAPMGSVTFDMVGAEFGHQGDDCTFETLIRVFGLTKDRPLASLAEIIHDIDLKDGKFGRTEAPGLDLCVRSMRASCGYDAELLEKGVDFFGALYLGLSSLKK